MSDVPAPIEPCPICGGALTGVHCKMICANCGYREDCSDIFRTDPPGARKRPTPAASPSDVELPDEPAPRKERRRRGPPVTDPSLN